MLRFLPLFVFFVVAQFSCEEAYAKKPKKQVVKTQSKKKAKASPEKEEVIDNSTVIKVPGTTEIPLLAKQVIVMDYHTGKVLLEKNADEKMPPSSMTKMMTSYLIEEKIMKNELKLDTTFVTSEKAWKAEGSRMFVQVGTSVSVSDLLKGIIIQSGNDASIVAAEGISGSEENFATLMNETAQSLGMTNTHFMNASGLPDENHFSTARDLAKLAVVMIRQHPEFYHLYSEKDFTYNNIKQGNRNPLLYLNAGCDGIKTGHTEAGGHGVTASFVDGEQRYIIVINGLKTMQKRAEESKKLLSWTKQNFLGKAIFKKGDIVEKEAPVWLGEKKTIPLKAVEDVSLLLPRSEQNKLEVKVQYDSPLQAPLKENQVVGKIVVTSPSNSYEISLAAAEDCGRASFFERMWNSVQYLISGKS